MTISTRDTILIAVFVNVGVMALLLMAAMRFDHGARPELLFTPQPKIERKISLIEEKEIIQELPKENPVVVKEYPQSFTIIETPHVDVKVPQEDFIAITVKRGDSLDKIARANGTTIQQIKWLNQLSSDQITVGQILKVPRIAEDQVSNKKNETKEVVVQEAIYHVVKSGDNPTKIARQFQVGYEDILRLNGLNEESARNLKPGDRVRIK